MLTQWLTSAWRRSFIVGALLLVALFGMPIKAQAVGSMELIALTNNERVKAGLSPLAYNGRLASSAYAKAQDMLAKGYWAHNAPDGTTPWVFVQNSGYAYVTVGENLARDFSTDASTVAGWMSSAGHRANILNPAFKDVGIAVASGNLNGEPTLLVVAHYGATSAQTAPAPKPAVSSAPKAAKTVASTQQTQQTAKVQAASAPEPTAKTEPKTRSPLDLLIENLVKLLQTTEVKLI